MTIEELGQRTKAKYSEYSKYSDAEVGQKVLAKYPVYQSQITQADNQLKKPTGVLNFLMGGALKATNDISAGIAQRQSGVNESQNVALDMQSKMMALARNSGDPEAVRRAEALSQQTNQVVGQGAQQQASQYSEDVNANPLLRGLDAASGIVGTADVGYQGVKAITKIPSIVKAGGKKALDVLKYKQAWGEARRLAAESYSGKDIFSWKDDALNAVVKQLDIDPSKLAQKTATDVVNSLDNAKSVSDILERTVQWGNSTYTGKGAIKNGVKPEIYNAVLRVLKQHMVEEAPEVAKYTDLLRKSYQYPKNVMKFIFGTSAVAGGIAAGKYLLSGGNR